VCITCVPPRRAGYRFCLHVKVSYPSRLLGTTKSDRILRFCSATVGAEVFGLGPANLSHLQMESEASKARRSAPLGQDLTHRIVLPLSRPCGIHERTESARYDRSWAAAACYAAPPDWRLIISSAFARISSMLRSPGNCTPTGIHDRSTRTSSQAPNSKAAATAG